MENNTEVIEFTLLELSNTPGLQVPLFILFTLTFLTSVVGNLKVILLILLDSCLHTFMCFFLSYLFLVDYDYSAALTPKVMAGSLITDKVISYNACAAQIDILFYGLWHYGKFTLGISGLWSLHSSV